METATTLTANEDQIRSAIAATRGGWESATTQQRAHCWQSMDEADRVRALHLAGMSDDDRAKFLADEKKKAAAAHQAKPKKPADK